MALTSKQDLELLNQALNRSEARFRTIFEQAPFSIQIFSTDGKTVLVNKAWEELWDVDSKFVEDYILKDYNILHDPVLKAKGVLDLIGKGFDGEIVQIPELLYDPAELGKTGRPRWVEATLYPLKDADGAVKEVVLIHTDVSRQRFLANVSELLLSTLDHGKILEQLVNAAVPVIADGCILDLIQDGQIKRLSTQHRDPKVQGLLKELQKSYPPKPESPAPSSRVFRTGEPELLRVVDSKEIRAHCIDDHHADLISRIGINSHIAVPIVARGKIIGALSLLQTTQRRPFDEQDLEVSLEFARRAALALDNSRLYEEAKAAIQLRDEFISIASHELKTPITSLKLQAQNAAKKLERSEQAVLDRTTVKKLVDNTNRQMDRLTRLVRDMLEISRIQAGKLEMRFQSTELSQLVHESAAAFAEQLTEQGIQLTVDAEENIVIECDAFRIDQVIANLLTNAVRYGDNSPIHLALARAGEKVHISVSDQGRGIDSADQKRIFLRFERANSSHDATGLGLGLYISEQIVSAHGGQIFVQSEPEKGSTFTVELPISRPSS